MKGQAMNKPEMAQPKKMDLGSMDVAAEKREELKRALGEAFPDAFTEGGVDFDQLRRALGDWVDPGKERFGLNWPGKAECMKIIQQPSVATLKPEREESVDFDATENVFIEGDNLEVLKLLQKAYFGKVKMIYIDPPYNTGGEFIYPDKYSETLDTYLAYTGQKSDDGKVFSTNTDASGRFHSRWLSMMYSRLYLAANLLREDGVFLTSIDQNELDNLIQILNQVLGEENFIAILTWEKGRKNDSFFFSDSAEYILIYGKSREALTKLGPWREKKDGVDIVLEQYNTFRNDLYPDHEAISRAMRKYFKDIPDGDPRKEMAHFSRSDERGLYFGDNISSASTSIPDYEVYHPLTRKPVKKPNRGWGCTEPVMKVRIAEDRVEFGSDETSVPKKKSYLKEVDSIVKTPVIYKDGRAASKRLEKLFGSKAFDNPKDAEVLADVFSYCGLGEGDTLMDFFAGSASSAEAVWLLSRQDGLR